MRTNSSPQPPVTPAAPTAATKRHGLVDALRGFALLGILVVNIEFIVQPAEFGWFYYDELSERVVRWLVVAFGQTKVYPLFALLFGYGLTLQLERVDRSGGELRARYRRRMAVLAVLGVLHGVLFFPGDILVLYAAIGAFAYRYRQVDTPVLLRLATRIYGVAAIFWLVLGALDALDAASVPTASTQAIETLTSGSFLEVVILHFFYWLATAAILLAIQGPAVFASFLAGVALGRTDWLSSPERHRTRAWQALRWAPLGVLGASLGATLTIAGGRWETLGFALGFTSAPLVAAMYLAGLALLLGRDRPHGPGWVSRTLQASGRMSLTVYLLESAVASTIAYGYGFGRFGQTGPTGGMVLALTIWLALSAFAVIWMRFARFGPFEWMLRSMSYGKRQPLRKARPPYRGH